MSPKLKVRIRRAEGCLLRLLGQIGRRGYEVLAVSARLDADRKAFEVDVEFEPFIPMGGAKPRPVEVLPALVAKLEDVIRVELVAPAVSKSVNAGPGNGSAQEAPRKAPAGEGR
jgi:acetolactate synthase regulatory subunit